MVYLDTYEFKCLNAGKIAPKEFFMNKYVEEVYQLEQVHTCSKNHIKFWNINIKSRLNKVSENQLQQLKETEHNEFTKLLPKS